MSTYCSICLKEYEVEIRVPKLLVECGHTFCILCVFEILEGSSKNCPNCEIKLLEKDVDSYPTNIAILDIIQRRAHKEETMRLKSLKSKLEEAKRAHQTKLEVINHNLSCIKEITAGAALNQLSPAMVEQHLKELKLSYTEDLEHKFEHKLEDYRISYDYFYEVGRGVRRGQRVYAGHKGPKGFIYGEVTIPKDYVKRRLSLIGPVIKVGCLTLSRVEGDAAVTPLEDLKKSVSEGSIIAFLELVRSDSKRRGKVFVRLRIYPAGQRVLKLFTGEEGSCFKGSPFHYDHSREVYTIESSQGETPSATVAGLSEASNFASSGELDTSRDPSRKATRGRWFAEGHPDGKLDIKFHRNNSSRSENVASERVYWIPPILFSKSCDGLVEDCGFVLKF